MKPWVLLSVCAVVLTLTSCAEGDGAAPDARSSGDAASRPTATPSTSTDALPTRPSGHAARLADQVRTVEAVLRDASAPEDQVRRAAEFQQLVARWLAVQPGGFRTKVLRLLDPASAVTTRANVTAAVLLRGMTDPQSALPEWRIVAPPPADTLLTHYRAAQRRTGVHWSHLAAIHLVESRMGRIRGLSTAGAQGPMQFLPSTWAAYGGGGDIEDPRDAILAAARLLAANGAPEDVRGALWNYNHSDSYVEAVLQYADRIRKDPHAFRAYWHWRVLYRHVRGTYVLEVGYPRVRPELLRQG